MAIAHVKLGLIGCTGTAPESISAGSRVRIVEMYDRCLTTAKRQAHESGVVFAPGLSGMLQRTQGVIVVDVGWMAEEPLIRSCTLQRPALVQAAVLTHISSRGQLRLLRFANQTRTLVMPALTHRWWRSTLRVRELTATRLGAIESMTLTCAIVPSNEVVILLMDWCASVVQSEIQSVSVSDEQSIRLRFRRQRPDGLPVEARIALAESAELLTPLQISGDILCRHGSVTIAGEQELEWSADRRGQKEQLAGDRRAHDFMYELFGRRVVGGVVPVPDLTDFLKAQAAALALRESRETGQAVDVELLS